MYLMMFSSLLKTHEGDSGGFAPVGAEGIFCASQHGAAVCGMLPREVEVCIVPNAGWKVHLNVCLQGIKVCFHYA